MTDPAAFPATDRLKNTLEEMRASAVANGLAGVVQKAILKFVELLMTLLEDFRAGKLVPIAPGPGAADVAAPRAADAGAAAADAGGAHCSGLWGWWRGKSAAPQ